MVAIRIISASLLATFVSALACNSLLGIDAPNVVGEEEDDCDEGDEDCPPTSCSDVGSTRCTSAGLIETCQSDGSFGNARACTWVCVNDACGGECIPDTTECANPTTPRTCNDQGEWQLGEECEAVCTGGACADACPDEGAHECIGGDQYVCSDGAWALEESCSFACDGGTGLCAGECQPDMTECGDSTTLIVCDASGNRQQISCESQTCVISGGEAACTGECTEGDSICITGVPHECNAAGEFVPGSSCDTPSEKCENGECITNTPYVLGHDDDTDFGDAASASTGVIYAFPLPAITQDVDVLSLGIDGKSNANGAQARVAIYEEESGGPGPLVMSSIITVVSDPNENDPTPEPGKTAQLLQGQTYWIAVLFSATPDLGKSDQVGAVGFVGSSTWPDLSNPFEAINTHNGVVWPLYAVVRDTTP